MMDDPGRLAERNRRQRYVVLAQAPEWKPILADLIQVAMSVPDPTVRCGRLDMVAHILESLTPLED
jgi:hypothetical protein